MRPSTFVFLVLSAQMALAVFMHPEKADSRTGPELFGYQLGIILAGVALFFLTFKLPAILVWLVRRQLARGQHSAVKPAVKWHSYCRRSMALGMIVVAIGACYSPLLLDSKTWPAVLPFSTVFASFVFGCIIWAGFAGFHYIARK